MAFLDALAALVLTSVSNSLTHQNPSLLTGCCMHMPRLIGIWPCFFKIPNIMTIFETFPKIAFLYPDLSTALLGRFSRGVAESVRAARLVGVHTPAGGMAEPQLRLEGDSRSGSYSSQKIYF